MDDRTEQAVQLPDGRTLGFADYGDPDGAAVVALHGIPACGLGYWVLDEAARRHHVRVPAPDRPGIRASSRRKGFTVADAGADVAAFARLLGLEQFGVLGWSGGGPYALAVAADPPPGLGRVVVVAGVGPPDWPGNGASLNALDRRLMRLCRHAPGLARAGLAVAVRSMRRNPAKAMRSFESELSAPDRAALAAAGPKAQDLTFVVESCRQGPAGVVDDYRALASPWGFQLESVTHPVVVWQGGEDIAVRPAAADEIVRRLPAAERRDFPGEGHLLPFSHTDELVALFAAG